jgi:hypothetical protein
MLGVDGAGTSMSGVVGGASLGASLGCAGGVGWTGGVGSVGSLGEGTSSGRGVSDMGDGTPSIV